MPPQPFRLTRREFAIRPYFGLSSTMAKGQVGEREAELMLKWRKQGRSLHEVMNLTGRTKVTVLNHTDPERKPRTGSGRPKCIGSKAFVKLEKALDVLQKRVDGRKEVTVSKVKHRIRTSIVKPRRLYIACPVRLFRAWLPPSGPAKHPLATVSAPA